MGMEKQILNEIQKTVIDVPAYFAYGTLFVPGVTDWEMQAILEAIQDVTQSRFQVSRVGDEYAVDFVE